MNELIRVTPQYSHCFFGYYDKTPWDPTEKRLLFASTALSGRLPKWGELLELGYVDLDSKEHFILGSTRTWNFQQGCMLQWLDESSIIYNNYDNGFVAQVVDLSGKLLRQYSCPIYALSHNKKIGMSVNFARINQYRKGYGYQAEPFVPNDEDGIMRLCMETGNKISILSFAQLKEQAYLQPNDYQYWIDHILFSPNDLRITFLLRSITLDGGLNSRLMMINSDGKNLCCLLNTGLASHADWFNDQHFAIWGRKHAVVGDLQKNKLIMLLKPLVQLIRKCGVPDLIRKNLYGDAFLMIDVDSRSITTFADNIPANEGGGHFTFDSTKQWMLNDTGINSEGMRALMLYHLPSQKRIDIASLYTPPTIHNTGYRCDLHPRWSPSMRSICVDSVHEGKRAMYVMDVSSYRRAGESFK